MQGMVQDNPTPSPASEVFPQVEFSPVKLDTVDD